MEFSIINQIHCRKCELKILDCRCNPIPCPFCHAEFGFTQDWNIHLIEDHNIINTEIDTRLDEPEFTARLID